MSLTRLACLAALGLAVANAPPAGAQELTGTLGKVRGAGTLVIGVRESSLPFSYLDDKRQPIGFAVDICMKVADAIKAKLDMPGLQVVLQPVTSSTRIPLLRDGTIDMECGSTTNNVARQQQVAFSNTYFLTANRFVAKAASPIFSTPGVTGIDALERKRVVSTKGTTNLDQLDSRNLDWKLDLDILATKDHAEAFQLVESGGAAAFVMDDVLLAGFIATSEDPSAYRISGDSFGLPEPYAIMLRKDDPEFKALVDGTTAALFRSPEGVALYNRWFTQPIPPRNINLNLPMAPNLARAFHDPSDSADPDHYGFW